MNESIVSIVMHLIGMFFLVLSMIGMGKNKIYRYAGLIFVFGTFVVYFGGLHLGYTISAQALIPAVLTGGLGWLNLISYGRVSPRQDATGKFVSRNSIG